MIPPIKAELVAMAGGNWLERSSCDDLLLPPVPLFVLTNAGGDRGHVAVVRALAPSGLETDWS